MSKRCIRNGTHCRHRSNCSFMHCFLRPFCPDRVVTVGKAEWVTFQKDPLFSLTYYRNRGWSGGAMVLGKLPVLGCPTYLENSRARAHCACSGCGWWLFGHFYSLLSFLSSFSLSLGDGSI